MKRIQSSKALGLAIGLLFSGLLLVQPAAQARDWHDTTVMLPGAQIHRHHGWLNRNRTEYRDMLGNHVSTKTRWWGRKDRDAHLFGATYNQCGDRRLSLRTPSGRPIIESHKSIFGKRTNHFDLSQW